MMILSNIEIIFIYILIFLIFFLVMTETKNSYQSEHRSAIHTFQLRKIKPIKKELLRCIHDLKGPLRSTCGLCQFLQSATISEQEKQRYHQLMMESLLKMNAIIDNLAQSLGKDEPIYDAPVDLNNFFTSLQKTHAYLIEQAQCTFDFLTPTLPLVKGHALDIERVLSNVVDNALKHKGKDPLVLRITAHQKSPFVHLFIEDNGTGINKSNGVAASLGEHPKGWGKGLKMSKKILKNCGGTLTLKPGKTEGCCVKITFLAAHSP